jgi:hypothetical protein
MVSCSGGHGVLTGAASVDAEDMEAARGAWVDAVEYQRSSALEFRFSNGCVTKGQFEPLVSEHGTCASLSRTWLSPLTGPRPRQTTVCSRR